MVEAVLKHNYAYLYQGLGMAGYLLVCIVFSWLEQWPTSMLIPLHKKDGFKASFLTSSPTWFEPLSKMLLNWMKAT